VAKPVAAMVLHIQSAEAINIILAVAAVAHMVSTATAQTMADLVAAAIAMDTDLQVERQQHITVVVEALAVTLTQVLADLDFKVLLLYDIETSKGKIWQRYRV
jgi:hypothetical protein